MVTITPRPRRRRLHSNSGFTLIEFMIAAAITTAVLGGTVLIATQMQQVYSTQLDDVTVEEEARFALDWISRIMRSAGSNPYSITVSACPEANTPYEGIRLDPNGNGIEDDVRVQADINPPDGIIIGTAGACTGSAAALGEYITIAHDAVNLVITRQDHAVDEAGVAMTEPIFTELLFTYLNSSRVATTNSAAIVYAQIRVTGQSRARNPITGEFTTSTLETEVRLRTR